MDAERVKSLRVDGRKSCSILPYSIPPGSQNVFFILGKESGDGGGFAEFGGNGGFFQRGYPPPPLAHTATGGAPAAAGTTTTATPTNTPTDVAGLSHYIPMTAGTSPSSMQMQTPTNTPTDSSADGYGYRQGGYGGYGGGGGVSSYLRRAGMLLGKSADEDWCDFGGSAVGEETFERAAARECVEESMNVVRFWADGSGNVLPNGDDVQDVIERLAVELEQERFTFRIIVCINHGAPAHYPRKYHICFVKQVPWQPDVQERFAERYNRASNHNERVRRMSLCESNHERDRSEDGDDGGDDDGFFFPNDNEDLAQQNARSHGENVDGAATSVVGTAGETLPRFMIDEETRYMKREYYEKDKVEYFNIGALLTVLAKTKPTFLRPQFAPLLSLVMHHFGYDLPSHRFSVIQQITQDDEVVLCERDRSRRRSDVV